MSEPLTLAALIDAARAQITELPPDAVEDWQAEHSDHLVLDVREPYEYTRGHIPGSWLVPRGTLEGAVDPHNKHRIEPVCRAQARPILVVCDTGARSAMAAVTLAHMGFESVVNLAGGMVLWEAEDLPVARGEYTGPLP